MTDKVTVHTGTDLHTTGVLEPHREDVVAVWLRERREELKQRSVGYDSRMAARYDALDDLLDEYRLRADLGLSLTAEIPGEAQR